MKKGLITSILALTFGSLQAQPLPPSPKLVVTLTIDQLRTDYMEAFSSLYGEKGVKRLLREGKVFRQADYSFNVADRASAIAALYTGTTPSMNGIIAERWFDPKTLRPKNCVDDSAFMGNYTDQNTAPTQLLTSTFADELKIATKNAALVYAIAPFRDAAVLSAGHSGNGAFWLNHQTGKWCGTTYYGEYPWSRFGMNLCMGSQADKTINRRLMMFVPFYVQEYFNQARIVNKEGETRPLVLNEEKIIVTGNEEAEQSSDGFTPMQTALLLLILTAAATIYGIRRKKTLWGIDFALFFAAGTAGCILAFLALFSQHPAVSPNYLLFVFHPLHLFCLPCMLNRVRKRKRSRYMLANFIVLTLFILLWLVIPQRFPLAVLPLALCLLIRSASNLILTYDKK